ncbi:hypothetical protein JYU34_017421 [Plutella xylostella]|uniref:Uncharacterized protein n=1 Tax=Plutella xylostella TaxID=51655 RepID=A0ABQ7Q1B8_PLUXY|nr:hypothetical protein JYU34_017421 [Plutella xylostella]
MAYTEKVSISGTALSFLLYECVNSGNGQEGFLIGDVTSEITNHISDTQSDSARLDTQTVIRTVLPLPSVSLFYLPTGKIKEDVLKEVLSTTASEIVGWYKYRKNNSIKPTFRDKLIAKGLQKYFDKYHDQKHFVTCNLTNKTTACGSTHTFTYRFGKINCFDMYEYIEDVTANLGEKLTGYKKPLRRPANCIFNKIITDCNIQGSNASDAILQIQEAVDVRLRQEALLAARNESSIRELEAEIKQMSTILSDKHAVDLQATHDKMLEENLQKSKEEMANACVEAVKTPAEAHMDISNFLSDVNHMSDSGDSVQIVSDSNAERSPSPVLAPAKRPTFNYAAALKKNNTVTNSSPVASSSKAKNFVEDLITFDVDDNSPPKIAVTQDLKCLGDSSPEY